MEKIQEALAYIRGQIPAGLQSLDAAIVCGSGLGGLVEAMDAPPVTIAYKDIPHFVRATVAGHDGKLCFGTIAKRRVALMVGRFHYYEGHELADTVFPIRVLAQLNTQLLIVTNAAGGLNPEFAVGDIMVILDHLNLPGLSGLNPLRGPNDEKLGPRFPGMADAYDIDWRRAAFRAAERLGMGALMREGTYCFVGGPSYETVAESRLLRLAGGDAVGMSTVPEVVAARHAGVKVLGLSLITNAAPLANVPRAMANGSSVSEPKTTHEEVLATSARRAVQFQSLVRGILDGFI